MPTHMTTEVGVLPPTCTSKYDCKISSLSHIDLFGYGVGGMAKWGGNHCVWDCLGCMVLKQAPVLLEHAI